MSFHPGLSVPAAATALGLVLIGGAPAAKAQAVITREIVDQPVETVITGQPAATVVAEQPLVTVPAAAVPQTETVTTTVRTVRRAPARTARRQIVTTRTITRRVVAAPTVVARTVPVTPQPLYDEVAPAPLATSLATSAAYDYGAPLYDEVVPAAAPVAPVAAIPVVPSAGVVATQPFIYRYVYQPDRILVVDPNTGVAVQSIPR